MTPDPATAAAPAAQDAAIPVAGIQQLLAALQDPVRLEMVRRLVDAGGEAQCKLLYDGVGKSTAAHHFKILREAGITERLTVEGTTYQRLRSADLAEAAPGLLDAVVGAAQRETG
ncbi:ArsR/SmtB family transcription factor [Nocardioides jiangxiensis]|uniref:Helix-turn-helix transcriptional regulator n=1 Tax=Nocardioides jiangxiensis TaxID=3064524 RepID=A0ABT9B0N7_9ACTN|nr:helix-turn-helix transcriptional regulator [Nocardioides sp. WY-20]MDO7868429.1 helix-turn-helix transcriptional regulator [Nocardioides sp. WY-20]